MMELRLAGDEDLELMMAWRSSPLLYEGFITQQGPLTWEEHVKWIKSRNKDWRTFLIIYEGRKIGVVTIGQLDHWSPEIGYYIGDTTLWGKGLGSEAVKLALEWIKNYGRKYVHTTVKRDNKRSYGLLKGLGFEELGEAREEYNEVWMTKKLSS